MSEVFEQVNEAAGELCSSPPGICVAKPVQVSVSLPLSVDVPLPYQVVRGEQLELRGSVYNQQADSIMVPTPRRSSRQSLKWLAVRACWEL